MAWRDIVGPIVAAALDEVLSCVEEGSLEKCARLLLASADALYAPLKPVDSGLGEARRLASRLAGVISNAFLVRAREKWGETGPEYHELLEALEKLREEKNPLPEAAEILAKAGLQGFEPAVSREARETIYSDVKNYVEPPQPTIPRRRRRQVRRPDPRQALRRILRELGRRDPILAKQINQTLLRLGVL